jgi:hypothetical protein
MLSPGVRLHPEAKSLCDGLPCDEDQRNSTGVLTRRAAFIPCGLIENIGKESSELQQTPGLVQDEDELAHVYRDRTLRAQLHLQRAPPSCVLRA